MLAPPRKRPRSSSPPDDLASPLDILLKRRRQRDDYNDQSDDYISYLPTSPYDNGDTEAESSSAPWNRFIEKRRTRQWEKLNNPYHQSSAQQATSSPPAFSNHQNYSSPIRPKMYSQPEPTSKAPMSSSPIRHHPPSSSPFKPSIIPRSSFSEEGGEGDEEMNEEEMKREWGEEYFNQNSLLRNLHMERASSHGLETMTPGRPSQTPSFKAMSTQPPSQPSHTPYRNAQIPPSSPFFHHGHQHHQYLPSDTDTPYRNGFSPTSSPYPSQTITQYSSDSHMTPAKAGTHDVLYNTPVHGHGSTQAEEIRNQYEATNRLLADLAVDRQRRWGH